MNTLTLITRRRRSLARHFDVVRQFEELEESCVPSYVHPNAAAAAVSWWRLLAAARLYGRFAPAGAVLDFGAGTGEVLHFLRPSPERYDFIEGNDILAGALCAFSPAAVRRRLDEVEQGGYGAVLALDSLEHNDDVGPLVARLAAALRPGGVMIVSGPTENWLYRLGRRLAGFSGHYHTTTIHHIEAELARHLTLAAVSRLPAPGATLFRVSAWKRG